MKKEKKTVLKLQKHNNKYANRLATVQRDLSKINDQVVALFNTMGVKNVNMASVGNSIATGYTRLEKIVPFLRRNKDFIEKCAGKVNLKLIQIARAQNNSDRRIFEWIEDENFKLSAINTMVRCDFKGKNCNMGAVDINDDELNEYFPISPVEDVSFKQFTKCQDNDMVNIVFYNGATGSFLDNFTRKGRFFRGINQDIDDIKASIRVMTQNNPHIQIYLYGVEKLGHTNIIYGRYNKKIKKIAAENPNVIYVEPSPVNLIYKSKEGKIGFDIHPDVPEYMEFNKKGMETVYKNFGGRKICIELLLKMKEISEKAELDYMTLEESKIASIAAFNIMIEKYSSNNEIDKAIIVEGIRQFKNYYSKLYPHYLFYTPKKDIQKQITKNYNKHHKR